jgi:hypothetical protein
VTQQAMPYILLPVSAKIRTGQKIILYRCGFGANEILICKPALVFTVGADVDMYGNMRC